eukprot:gene3537-1754_t
MRTAGVAVAAAAAMRKRVADLTCSPAGSRPPSALPVVGKRATTALPTASPHPLRRPATVPLMSGSSDSMTAVTADDGVHEELYRGEIRRMQFRKGAAGV